MRHLIVLLFSFQANAICYLMPDLNDPSILKVENRNRAPGNQICQVQCDGNQGDVYDVRIVEIPDGFIGQILDLIGLGNDRPWAPGEVVADNEQIVCTIDPVKVQAKADARAAAEAAEKAKRDKRKSDWDTLCAAPKAGLETILCEERGY